MNRYTFLGEFVKEVAPIDPTRFQLENGITKKELDSLQNRIALNIPEELREFYQFSYGAKLDEYRILKLPDIRTFISRAKVTYNGSWKDTIIPFAYLVGVGDFMSFDLEESNTGGFLIRDCFHELNPQQWGGVCHGLEQWLRKMINSNFKPFWL
jgi:SMI1 / KNR4 family (SUKH-1)